jgi:hypothetical protein
VDVQSIAANAFPDSCKVLRNWSIVVIGLNNQKKKKRRGKWETKKGKRRTGKEEN